MSQASISTGCISGIHLERKLPWSMKGHRPCEQGASLDKFHDRVEKLKRWTSTYIKQKLQFPL